MVIGAVALWGTLLAVEGTGQTSGLNDHLATTPTTAPPEPAAHSPSRP